MMTLCLGRSKAEGCFAERAIEALSHWWTMYTVLHNRGIIEQLLREKQARSLYRHASEQDANWRGGNAG